MSVQQTPDQNRETVRKLYEDIINTGNLESLDQMIAEDYVGIYGQTGPAAFAETITSLRQGFPDIKWTIEDLVAEGDRVAVRWTWKGTNSGSFRGLPPSQKQVHDKAIAIYQFRDGKILHAWIETDRLGMLQQIGVIPQNGIPQSPTGNN